MSYQPISFSGLIPTAEHHLELRRSVSKLVGGFGRKYYQDVVKRGAKVTELQVQLRELGYDITPSGSFDRATVLVVLAFQRHWRQARVDGRFDHSTLGTLGRLRRGRLDYLTPEECYAPAA